MKKIFLLIVLIFLNVNFAASAADYTSFDLSKTDTFLNLKNKLNTQVVVYADLQKIENFNSDFSFASSNAIVAAVNSSGYVQALNVGYTVVSLYYQNTLRASIVIVVTDLDTGRIYYDSFESDANKTSDYALGGTYSYDALKGDKYCMNPLGHSAMMWFYDDMNTTTGFLAITDQTPSNIYCDIGISSSAFAGTYVLKDTTINQTLNTKIARSNGWHQVFVDYSTTGRQILYLDGTAIYNSSKTINPIYWIRIRAVSGTNRFYADDFATFTLDGKPVAYDLNISGGIAAGNMLTAEYKVYHPRGHSESNTLINWYKSADYAGTYTKVGEGTAYTVKSGEENSFFKFEVTPKTATYTGVTVASAVKTKNTAPAAKNIVVSGSVETGDTLQASYEYFDVNGDTEEGSIYEWYISGTRDGEYIQIPFANALTYTVTAADNGKYIKFAVTPKTSQSEPYIGEKVFSEAVEKAVAPVASDVTIDGLHSLGAVLTGSYKYYDANRDEEGESIIEWLRKNTDNQTEMIGKGSQYTLTEQDIDKTIYFAVTPVSRKTPYQGETVMSEGFVGLSKPQAKNVKIGGSAAVGQLINGEYTYSHSLGIGEGKSKYRWLVKSGSGYSEIGNEISLKISSDLSGKSIVFEVTPVAAQEPAAGEAVKSPSVSVSKSETKSVRVGGGGGGGGGSSVVVIPQNTPTPQPSQTPEPTPYAEDNSPVDAALFTDISGHWAETEIRWAVENGYSKGVSADSFDPEGSLTNAQMATLLARAAKLEPADYKNVFSDVTADKWYAGFIQAMADKKIIAADTNKFEPEQKLTRENMAVMVMKTYAYLTGEEIAVDKKQNISDREMLKAWNEVYVDKAMELGIIKGMGNNAFKPLSFSTRAQAVTFIKRLIESVEGINQ